MFISGKFSEAENCDVLRGMPDYNCGGWKGFPLLMENFLLSRDKKNIGYFLNGSGLLVIKLCAISLLLLQ